MSLTIPVPDDVQASLEGEWGDLARHLQESLAVDGYRYGATRVELIYQGPINVDLKRVLTDAVLV
jgi:hypothetical protein